NISDAALARLTVDSDDRLVAATDVGRIDWNVENIPWLVGLLNGPRLFYRVLMRAAESRKNQLSRVRLPGRHLEAGAPFVDITNAVDVREIESRMNAIGVQIQRDG